jgi:hypothetical protein
MSVRTGRQNIIFLFRKEQFHFWKYINGNQTFIMDSHWPFICSVGRILKPESFQLQLLLSGSGKIDKMVMLFNTG